MYLTLREIGSRQKAYGSREFRINGVRINGGPLYRVVSARGTCLKQRAWANSNKEPDPMDRVPHPQTPYMGISEWYLVAKFMLVNKTYPRGKPSLFTSNTEQTLNRHSGNYTSRWRKMKVCDVTSYKYLSHPQTTRRIYQNCRPNDRLKNWVECLTT